LLGEVEVDSEGHWERVKPLPKGSEYPKGYLLLVAILSLSILSERKLHATRNEKFINYYAIDFCKIEIVDGEKGPKEVVNASFCGI